MGYGSQADTEDGGLDSSSTVALTDISSCKRGRPKVDHCTRLVNVPRKVHSGKRHHYFCSHSHVGTCRAVQELTHLTVHGSEMFEMKGMRSTCASVSDNAARSPHESVFLIWAHSCRRTYAHYVNFPGQVMCQVLLHDDTSFGVSVEIISQGADLPTHGANRLDSHCIHAGWNAAQKKRGAHEVTRDQVTNDMFAPHVCSVSAN
jgi:hypothetical protein